MVDAERLVVLEAGRALPVAPKVVELLAVLCDHAGTFVSKETLRECVWPGAVADDSVLWQKMYLVRKLLAPYFGSGSIEVLPRRGYRLTVEVRTVPHGAAAEVPAAPAPRLPSRHHRLIAGLTASATIACLALAGFLILEPSSFVMLAPSGFATRERPRSAPTPIWGPAPLRAYNLGRYFLSLRTYDGTLRAEREFMLVSASRSSATAALGYAGLADSHTILAADELSGARALEEARAARASAETALHLDPNCGEAEASLGSALFEVDLLEPKDGRMREDRSARAAFATAVALRPGYATAHLWFGHYLLMLGDARGALEQYQRAVDLDPSSAVANSSLADVSYLLGDADGAAMYASRAIAFRTSDPVDALGTLGLAQDRRHHFVDALHTFRTLARYSPRHSDILTAYIEVERGENVEGARLLRNVLRRDPGNTASFWMNVALIQFMLGDRAAAAVSLQNMARTLHGEGRLLALDPRLAAFRRDPRLRGYLVHALGA